MFRWNSFNLAVVLTQAEILLANYTFFSYLNEKENYYLEPNISQHSNQSINQSLKKS